MTKLQVQDIEAKLDELKAGKKKWVRGLDKSQKKEIIRRQMGESDKWPQILRYLDYVAVHQKPHGCGKCRYTQCEKCSFSNAQNYVLRHAKCPVWWTSTLGR